MPKVNLLPSKININEQKGKSNYSKILKVNSLANKKKRLKKKKQSIQSRVIE